MSAGRGVRSNHRKEERRTATASIDGENVEICHRLLQPREARDVVSTVGYEKFSRFIDAFVDAVGETDVETVERYQELATIAVEDVNQLDEEEQTEFVNLSEKLDNVETELIGVHDDDIAAAMRKVVEYTVEPYDDDRKIDLVTILTDESASYAAFCLGFKIFSDSVLDGNVQL